MPSDPTRVWKRPGSIGDAEAIRGMGGVVSPLLAGFALATIAVLMTSADPKKTPLAPWAVLCLAGAAVAFLYVMQYSFLAVRSGSSPSSYIDWEPEVTINQNDLSAFDWSRLRTGDCSRYSTSVPGGSTTWACCSSSLASRSSLFLQRGRLPM